MRIKTLIVLTISFLFFNYSLAVAEECPQTSVTMRHSANKQLRGYEIARFGSFSETDQNKIYEKTKHKCPHILKIGSSTYAVLMKHRKQDSYAIVVASALDCMDNPWAVKTVDTFNQIPIMSKVDPTQTYTNKETQKEIIIGHSYMSLIVSFLNTPDQILYTTSRKTGKYEKHKI